MKIDWEKTGLDFSGEGFKEVDTPRMVTNLGVCERLELNCDAKTARFIIEGKYYAAHEITDITVKELIEGEDYYEVSGPLSTRYVYKKV